MELLLKLTTFGFNKSIIMSVLTSLLRKTSSIKEVCILFVVSHFILLLMMVFTFPVINSQIGTKAFDLQTFGYSVSTAKTIIDSLDYETTELYLFPQLTLLDLFYPFLLALFLSSFSFRLIQTDGRLKSILILVPFLAMFFDYSENVCVILMISKFVAVSKSIVLISSSFTVLKSLLSTISWIMILVYSIKWLILRFRKNKL